MRGTVNEANPWTEMVDLFFYRDPAEMDKEDAAREETHPVADYAHPAPVC